MPDISGWSRKEVTELWSLTDVAFTLNGYGIVTSQSIAPGEMVYKDSVIEVTFGDIADPNPKPETSEAEQSPENSEEVIES